MLTSLRPCRCPPVDDVSSGTGSLWHLPAPGTVRGDVQGIYALPRGGAFLKVSSDIAQSYFTSQAGRPKKVSSDQIGPDKTGA